MAAHESVRGIKGRLTEVAVTNTVESLARFAILMKHYDVPVQHVGSEVTAARNQSSLTC